LFLIKHMLENLLSNWKKKSYTQENSLSQKEISFLTVAE
jgi:hypothetical protein